MTGLEQEIIRFLQADMPIESRPYKKLAVKSGISEKEITALLKKWKDNGILHRISVIIRHQKAGFKSAGMSVWKVPDERFEQVGKLISSFAEVGHCYQRQTFTGWPYNIFAMIHGRTREVVIKAAQEISLSTSVKEYDILFTEKEFKKSSMEYFVNEIPEEAKKYNA